MAKARKEQICLEATPYYHCVSRCVRRAFLCGEQYEHRRQWVEDKLIELAGIFCIDIAAYAVMSNHYHVVLHVDKKQAQNLDVNQVIERWHQLYRGNYLSQKFELQEKLDPVEIKKLLESVQIWRCRLMDISWFMRVMNEFIAREANKEDQCTGRFWEGRFKSQALLDEKALLACMAYVDLNPIRAKVAKTPETSSYTSVKKRCEKAKHASSPNHKYQQPRDILPFIGCNAKQDKKGVPFTLEDYLTVVDFSGRAIRDNKRGKIQQTLPAILNRLGIEQPGWEQLICNFERQCKSFVGGKGSLEKIRELFGCERIGNQAKMLSLF